MRKLMGYGYNDFLKRVCVYEGFSQEYCNKGPLKFRSSKAWHWLWSGHPGGGAHRTAFVHETYAHTQIETHTVSNYLDHAGQSCLPNNSRNRPSPTGLTPPSDARSCAI